MVIEWLKFCVSPAHRQRFLEADRTIWTAAFADYSGFLGKQVWSPPDDPAIVVIVIQWQSRAVWQAFPSDRTVTLNRAFDDQVGVDNYQLLEIADYDVLA